MCTKCTWSFLAFLFLIDSFPFWCSWTQHVLNDKSFRNWLFEIEIFQNIFEFATNSFKQFIKSKLWTSFSVFIHCYAKFREKEKEEKKKGIGRRKIECHEMKEKGNRMKKKNYIDSLSWTDELWIRKKKKPTMKVGS